MTQRYFSLQPVEPRVGAKLELTGDEVHHLVHVMRVRPGEEVMVFDGSGRQFKCRVESTGRNLAVLTVLSVEVVDRELCRRLVVACALPKQDRQHWLVEKLVELGAAELIPLQTARSVVKPKQNTLEKLRRYVVEASKQCGRNILMQIHEPCSWADLLGRFTGQELRLVCHPCATQEDQSSDRIHRGQYPCENRSLCELLGQNKHDVVVAVGPEGGLTSQEFAQAVRAGWQPVDLGPRILRVETAAVAVCALIAAVDQFTAYSLADSPGG